MLDFVTIGYLGIVLMLALAVLGVPLAYSMCGVATLGLCATLGVDGAATQNILLAWEQGSSFSLMSIPLFIVMGTMAYYTGIVSDIFDTVRKWVGHVPGGLAVSGVLASAVFGAVTGSTAAAAATMSSTVLPELKKHKYSIGIASGSIAASAGLAALIPPSVFVIIYAVLTDQSIGQLFVATIIPGLLVTSLFSLWILLRCSLNPELGPPAEKSTWKGRIVSLLSALPVLFVFTVVIGGIYSGLATPTEAAAMGMAGVLVIAACMRRLTLPIVKEALREGSKLSATIFFLIIGGWLMSRFLVTTGTTRHMVDMVVGLNLSYYGLVLMLFGVFMVMGCILESTSILILTMPLLFPITRAYGMDPAWFCVFVTMMVVLAGITPPVGLNVFVLHSVDTEVPIFTVFRGAVPFMIIMLFVLMAVVLFPGLATWLPKTMMGL